MVALFCIFSRALLHHFWDGQNQLWKTVQNIPRMALELIYIEALWFSLFLILFSITFLIIPNMDLHFSLLLNTALTFSLSYLFTMIYDKSAIYYKDYWMVEEDVWSSKWRDVFSNYGYHCVIIYEITESLACNKSHVWPKEPICNPQESSVRKTSALFIFCIWEGEVEREVSHLQVKLWHSIWTY